MPSCTQGNAPCLTVGVWYNLSIKSFAQQGSVVVPTNHIDAFAG